MVGARDNDVVVVKGRRALPEVSELLLFAMRRANMVMVWEGYRECGEDEVVWGKKLGKLVLREEAELSWSLELTRLSRLRVGGGEL